MARNFGRIRLSIADDEDFEALTPEGQWLFCRIGIPETTLNHCGIFDWRPKRMLRKARGLTIEYLEHAAADCEQARFMLFDLETEEALLRSYVRSEELLRNPKHAVSVLDAYRSIVSKQLRAAIADEIRRVKAEHPEYNCWDSTYSDVGSRLTELLGRPGLDARPYSPAYANTDRITNGISNGEAMPKPNPITNGDTESGTYQETQREYQRDTEADSLHLAPSTYDLAPTGGYVSTEGNQAEQTDTTNDPPPRVCPEHWPDGTKHACLACQAARERNEAWFAARRQTELEQLAAEREEAAATSALAIARCELCDDDGYRAGLPCDHVDRTETAARGIAAVRAALASKGTDQ